MKKKWAWTAFVLLAGCTTAPPADGPEESPLLSFQDALPAATEAVADVMPDARLNFASMRETRVGANLAEQPAVRSFDHIWTEPDPEVDGRADAWFFGFRSQTERIALVVYRDAPIEWFDDPALLDKLPWTDAFDSPVPDTPDVWKVAREAEDVQSCLEAGPLYIFTWTLEGHRGQPSWVLRVRLEQGFFSAFSTGHASFDRELQRSGPGYECPAMAAEAGYHNFTVAAGDQVRNFEDQLNRSDHPSMALAMGARHPTMYGLVGVVELRVRSPTGEEQTLQKQTSGYLRHDWLGDIPAGTWSMQVTTGFPPGTQIVAGWCAMGAYRGDAEAVCRWIELSDTGPPP